jgi:23S rRNA (cytidine1920-2'-O)/16S rRNA (cytidine1409-2'-O)-methyltransferase
LIASRGPKSRLDVLLVERGLAPSRARAQALVMAGLVDVNGVRVDKAGTTVSFDAAVQVRSSGSAYVSRGGEKLAGALASFEPHGLQVRGVVAADFGASTGGFVDCLLQHGAARVHAIDVGHGLLHERLRGDERVVVWERTNARHVTIESIGESVGLVVIDASFIGLSKLLGAVREVLREGGELVALIKPQFEAGRREVARGRGVIRDDEVRANVIHQVLDQVSADGFDVIADAACVITGPKGNREHFVYARKR